MPDFVSSSLFLVWGILAWVALSRIVQLPRTVNRSSLPNMSSQHWIFTVQVWYWHGFINRVRHAWLIFRHIDLVRLSAGRLHWWRCCCCWLETFHLTLAQTLNHAQPTTNPGPTTNRPAQIPSKFAPWNYNSARNKTVTLHSGPLHLGLLNCRSAVNKIALIHDLINDRNLDVTFLSET